MCKSPLLSWRPPSPNKRLTYEKCFVHPLVDYKSNLNIKVHILFRQGLRLQKVQVKDGVLKCKYNFGSLAWPLHHISCRIFEFLKLAPKTSQYLADRAAVSCCICPMHFCIKVFGFFNKYIFKRMWNSSFLTSITYSLTPSMSNLVNVIATASKLLFTMRPLHAWGRSFRFVLS